MKKIKNIKLMLIGLFAMVGMSAFADDYVYAENLVYKVVDADAKTVNFYGLSEKYTVADWSKYTLVIPATITTAAPGTGANTTYKVVGFESSWPFAKSAGSDWGTQEFSTSLEMMEINFPVKDASRSNAWYPLTQAGEFTNLRTFKLGDCRTQATLPVIDAGHQSKLEKLDLEGVSNDKDPIAIPDNWADLFSALKEVKLPTATELTIGDNAFRGTVITAIDLANVTTIGANAFQGTQLTTIDIPASVTSIGAGAFWSMTKATTINFNAEMEEIPAVFSNINGVTTISISSATLKSIPTLVFAEATGVKFLTIDAENLTTIANDAFAAAPFQKIDLEDTGLASVTIPLTNTSIKATDGTGLNTFLFPKALTTLPTFNGFAALATINAIPAGVSSIPTNAFLGTKVKDIAFAENSVLTAINDNAFQNNTTLETMDLSNAVNLETIGNSAFDGCTGLKTITFGGTKLYSIGNKAFFHCEKLEGFDMSKSNKDVNYNIGTSAFEMAWDATKKEYKTALTSVKLPDVTSINTKTLTIKNAAFLGCAKLTSVDNLNQSKLVFDATGYQFYDANLTGSLDLSAAKAKAGTAYLFSAVPQYAFAGNKGITAITLPEGISAINQNAFEGCEALATVNWNDLQYLTTLATSCFEGCGLTELDLTNIKTRVGNPGAKSYLFTEINDRAFALNKNLKTVNLPAQIDFIGNGAFCYDVALESINLNKTNISILYNLFTENLNSKEISLDKLTSIILEKDKATKILNADDEEIALADLAEITECALQFTGLTEITIPESVSKFGTDNDVANKYGTVTGNAEYRVFQGCTNLKKFTWKNAMVTVLGDNTFRGDGALEEVHFLTTSTINDLEDENIFYMCDMDKLTVYVTSDSYNKLVANGYGNDNRQYSKLDVEGNVQFEFKESGLASDGYYYATYNNKVNSSWFKADEFDVYSAVVEGAKVVLKPATAEGGYYKVARYVIGSNEKKALCVVRSKNIKAVPELKSNGGSDDLSTLPADNDLKYCATNGAAGGSKLNYTFKLGKSNGKVAFYRFTKGEFKANTLYIQKAAAGRIDAMDIVIEGETTGINAIEENVESDNAPIYNLQGVRVNGTQKGMYIKNGKKFMVK